MSEWISVFDMRPSDGDFALCYRPESSMEPIKVLRVRNGQFSGVDTVTHWMPLPEPPKD